MGCLPCVVRVLSDLLLLIPSKATRQCHAQVCRILLGLGVLLTIGQSAFAGTFTAFGPQNYTRGTGDPITVTNSFSVLNPNTQYTLKVFNGGLQDASTELVSSTIVTLNGVQVVGTNNFNQNVTEVDVPVTLQGTNTLAVQVRGQPGGVLTVEIIGVDNDPPTIQATVSPGANAAGWNNTNVTVTFVCSDATSGVATCPGAQTITTEGANQIISGTATDNAGNTASTSVTLNIDKTPPAITAALSPAPNAAGWNNSNVTVTFTCSDSLSGVANCPLAATVTTEGANQLVSGTATDVAGNTASTSVKVSLDKTPPSISITSPANGATFTSSSVAVTGSVSDALSGIAAVTCDGAAATVQNGSFSCSVTLASGPNTITAQATDVAGNNSSASENVTFSNAPPPAISSFSPASGPVGTQITITGSNFSANGTATPQVTLSQQGGGTINAPIASFTATSISFVIPAGAASGTMTVTVGTQSTTSADSLSVVPSSSFSVNAGPSSASVIQGTSTTYTVSLSSTNNFTQLASLSVAGLPTGVTATFSPAQITVGQFSILTVTAPAGQAASSASLTISASATVDGIQSTQSASVGLAVQAATTSLIGRTVESDNNETPVPGITITLLGVTDAGIPTGCSGQTRSDASGNFAFTNLPSACLGRQLVGYNGDTATDGEKYAGVNLAYTMIAGQVTGPELVHMPVIDNAETIMVKQNASVDQVFSYSTIPGITVTVYAGTILTLPDGTRPDPFPMAAVPVPVDRLPDAPTPTAGLLRASIVAFQPADTTSNLPISVTFPNIVNTPPGVDMELDTLDPIVGELVKYGTGTVSGDGSEIVPDLDPAHPGHRFGITHFDWHGPMAPAPNANNPSPDPHGPKGGDPVDPATGLLVFSKTDIAINGALGKVAIIRNFRSMSGTPGPFGIGTNHNYGYLLDPSALIRGTGNFVNLVMPDGNRFPFAQQGTNTFANSTITTLVGAVISSPVSGTYDLRWKDGTVFHFQTSSQGALLAFLNSITDPNGNTTTLVRGNSTQPIQITQIIDPAGRALNFAYDSFNRILSITDPIGRSVQYTYNSQGTLATVTDPAGNIASYSYNLQNQLTSITDPRGVVFLQNSYDANGRVSQQVAADGGITTFSYTLLNPLVPTSPVLTTVVTDPLGGQTTYRFNPQGYLVQVTDALGQVRNFNRDPGTNLLLSLQGPGKCDTCGDTTVGDISFSYDTAGNLLSETDASGHSVQFTYDPTFSHLSSYTDEDGNVSRFAYDNRGNRTSFTDARGNTTFFTIDARGLTTQIKDAGGNSTNLGYDSAGDLISVQDPVGNTRRAAYDAVSRPVIKTDPAGNSISLSYDKLNRVVAVTDPLSNTTKFTYDAMGNLLTATDPRGNTTKLTYDAETRLQTQTDALGRVTSFAYDKAGDLIQTTDRVGNISKFGYDALRRLVSETYPDATVSRTYDGAGRLVRVADSQAGIFNTIYDAVGRVVGSSTPFGTINYVRDPAGRITSRTVVGQTSETFTYDGIGDLTSASMGTASVTMTYDARGLRRTISRSNGTNTSFDFDAVGRVISRVDSKGATVLNAQSYSYDATGRRSTYQATIAQALITPSATGSYDAANEIQQFGGQSYTTDANGNVTSITGSAGTTKFTWDARGRLHAITTPDGQATNFNYDFDNYLLTKQSSNGQTAHFVLDNLTNVALEFDNAGHNFSFLTGNGIDMQFGFLDASNQAHFALQGNLGSVVASTDSTGAIEGTSFFEPFGQTTTTGAAYPLAYGDHLQVASNLYYYRARYYDPISGRFLSEDPLGQAGYNPYQFVLNDPTNQVDPLGLQTPLQVGVGALAGAVVGVGGQFVGDLVSGHWSSWEDYTGAAVGGAVTGALVANFVPPAIAGGIGGAAGNLTKQTLNHFAKGCNFDAGDLAADTVIGAATGAIVPDVQGLNAGRGSIDSVFNGLNTKLANGTISHISPNVIGQEIGSQVAVGSVGGEVGGIAGTLKPDGCKDKNK
jgi:RHS repeat-associated protein